MLIPAYVYRSGVNLCHWLIQEGDSWYYKSPIPKLSSEFQKSPELDCLASSIHFKATFLIEVLSFFYYTKKRCHFISPILCVSVCYCLCFCFVFDIVTSFRIRPWSIRFPVLASEPSGWCRRHCCPPSLVLRYHRLVPTPRGLSNTVPRARDPANTVPHARDSVPCHRKEFAHQKLREKRNNEPGTYLLRQHSELYDVILVDVCQPNWLVWARVFNVGTSGSEKWPISQFL